MLGSQVASGFGGGGLLSYYSLDLTEETDSLPEEEPLFGRNLLRSSSGIDALKPHSDVVIPRAPKISPSPIGERADSKLSPLWDPGNGPQSPPQHIENLFGTSNPFTGVLRTTEIEFSGQDGDLEFSFDDSLQSPRRKAQEEENLFELDDGMVDPNNSALIATSPDQDSQGIQPDAFNTYGEHPLGEHPSRTLFVRNINSNVEDEELTALFEQYGPIRSMYTQCKHRGFVMISYYDIRHAKNAMRHLQSKVLRRRKLDIHYSIPKENPSEKDQNQGTLVVFNLDPATTNEELKAIFEAFGEIKEVRETPNKKHHKFIEFYDVRDAESAMKNLNKTEIRSKKIKIEPSRPGGVRKGVNQLSHEQFPEDDESFFAPQSLGVEELSSSSLPFSPSNHSYPPPQHNLPKYKANQASLAPIAASPYRPGKANQQMSPHSPSVFASNSPLYPRSPPMDHGQYGAPSSGPRTLSPAPSQTLWGGYSPKTASPSTPKSFGMSPPQVSQGPFAEAKLPPSSREKSPDENGSRIKRADSGEDKSRFKLVLHKVGTEDMRTTLMIKNIPNKYNQKMLLAAVDDRHKGAYDFFYLPIDFKNKCNVGYAFINFIGYDFIRTFYEEFNNKKWEKFNSEKVCNIAYARIQGKNALVQHFQNSSLMCEDKKCRPIIFHSVGPNVGEQEPFPVGPNLRRRNSDSPSWTSEDEP